MKTELGYYSVNGVSFSTNKVAAILEAQKTGVDIKWHYHDDILNSVDWTNEPAESLDQLYKIRAQQIRDAYDYVIVFCSGGADSTNVIRTFMDNNIRVDEVVAMIPESGINNWDWNDKDASPTNIMSETKYAQYPILHEVSVRKPETKITVTDIFKDMLNVESDAWIYETEGDMMDLGNYSYGKLDSLSYLVDMAERGVKIAAVWGTDKPIITIRDNDVLAATLVDSPIYLPKYPFKNVYPNVDRVLFYWTQDMPQLMIKQAHVVAREILKPENAMIYQACADLSKPKQQKVANSVEDILTNFRNPEIKPAGYYSPKTFFQRSIVPFIYPATWTNKVFQVNKFELSQTFMPAFSNWIPELHSGSRLMQLIESDFKLFYSRISPKYLNSDKTGFKMCVKSFPIGKKSKFINQK
jgi:hypothetical protein